MLIMPAIDLLGGRCVRLRQGRYDEATVFSEDPAATAQQFAADGLTTLHVVDLDGAKAGHPVNHDVIAAICRVPGIRVELGGGIRSAENFEHLLQLGVWRIVLGSIALRKPKDVDAWLKRWGEATVVLAVDMQAGMLAAGGWLEGTQTTPLQFIRRFSSAGARTFICTDISRDGMLKGPNTAWYTSLRAAFPSLDLVASGGITTVEDLRALEDTGLNGVILGRALYEGSIDRAAIRRRTLRPGGPA